MRKLLLFYEKGHAVRTELTWTHYRELLSIDDYNEILYYIDKILKRIDHDNTIGIIICKKDNKLVLEYSSDPRIYSTTYVLN